MGFEVIGTDEFADWYAALQAPAAEAVTQAVTVLESAGPAPPLATPLELKPPFGGQREPLVLHRLEVGGTPLRVLFVMEGGGSGPAVLLYGYDSVAEGPSGPRGDMPPLAHMFLAAKIYGEYKKAKV